MNITTKEILKEKLLTPKEFAGRLSISVRCVKRMIARREIHYLKIGASNIDACGRDRRAVRIPESEIYRITEVIQRII